MSWGMAVWLWALLGVAALAGVVALAGVWHRRRLGRAFRPGMFDRVLPPSVRARRTARDVLALLGLAAVVVALAEPKLRERVYAIEQKGIDLVVAVDLSRSMDASDVDPSRLERAKREIYDLLDMVEGDRLGLVIFAGAAYPRLPLTQDTDAVRLVTDELTTDTFQVQGSEVGVAVRQALDLLGEAGSAGQAILILSDGEVHRPEDALAAADEAAARGVRIFAMGIGREAAPIPVGDGNYFTDARGQTILSAPSAAVLTDVARITGGAYVQSVAAADDMAQLYRVEMRGSVEAGDRGTVRRRVAESAYAWPLGFGLVAWLVASWLGDGRRPWGAAAAVWLAFALVSSPAYAASRAEADQAYRAGRYAEAVRQLTELSMEDPDDPDLWERLGAAKYRAGDFAGAERAFEQADTLRGGDADAAYNAGNAAYRGGRLEEALRDYERALQLRPDHPGAQQNKQRVAQEIAVRRQNQPPPPSQGGEGGEQQQQPGEQGASEPQGGQPGESQPGESGQPGPQNPQAQQGEPSPGQPGTPPGQQSPGQGQPGQGERQGQQTDDQRRDDAPGSGVAELDELAEGDPTGEAAGAAGAEGDGGGQDGGPITPVQAQRLLEGVEEGRPRVIIPGQPDGGKPW